MPIFRFFYNLSKGMHLVLFAVLQFPILVIFAKLAKLCSYKNVYTFSLNTCIHMLLVFLERQTYFVLQIYSKWNIAECGKNWCHTGDSVVRIVHQCPSHHSYTNYWIMLCRSRHMFSTSTSY